MKVKVQITGMDALLADLKRVSPEKQSEIMTTGLMAGGEIIKTQAVANAPARTRKLKNSIRVRASALKTPGRGRVTVEVGKGPYKGEEFYGYFQEEGWRQGKRVRRRIGVAADVTPLGGPRKIVGSLRFARDTRRQIPGKHYMAHAFEVKGEQAMNTAISSIETQLDKAGL